jgi:hypothetical protein
MALPKYSGIKLGPGAINNQSYESQIYVEVGSPKNGEAATVAYDSGTTYSVDAPVLYNGVSYNSLQAGNLNNQPDISPLFWVEVDGKDGDIWIQVPSAGFPSGGGDTEIWLKTNKVWVAVAETSPVTVSLVDGQLTDTSALEYPKTTLPFALITYTVRRGSSHDRKRAGTLLILNDTSGVVTHTHTFDEIGSDVNVPFTVDLLGSRIRVRYTSAAEGFPIEMRYSIKGWA